MQGTFSSKKEGGQIAGTEVGKGERVESKQQVEITRTDAALAGINDAEIGDISRLDAHYRIETNLIESGFTEEDARAIADSRLGTETLAAQTGLTEEEMGSLTYAQITEQRKTYQELGLNESQITRVKENEMALRAAPRQLEKIEDPLLKTKKSKHFARLAILGGIILSGEAKEEEHNEAEFLSKYGTMNAQQAQELHKVLKDVGYSETQRAEIQDKWFEVGQAAYLEARRVRKPDEEARKASSEAQKQYLESIYLEVPEEHREAFAGAAELSLRQMEIGARAIEQAAETGDTNVVYAAQDAITEEQQREVISKYSLMSAFAVGALFGGMFGEGEAEEAPGAEAAAQAQLMRDIEDIAREDKERAEEAKALIESLMERAEESGEETKVADLNDEMKERLEKLGVEQDKTINDAVEFTNKIIENVSAQNGRVDELKRNAVAGLEPSFHENPREVLEMNGITKGGNLTEFGQSVMPDVLRASGNSFNGALDQIMDAIPIDGREEFMDRVGEARLTINEYMADPGNAEKQAAAAEILVNPEFVAVRAAFEEALADNAADTLKKLNA